MNSKCIYGTAMHFYFYVLPILCNDNWRANRLKGFTNPHSCHQGINNLDSPTHWAIDILLHKHIGAPFSVVVLSLGLKESLTLWSILLSKSLCDVNSLLYCNNSSPG